MGRFFLLIGIAMATILVVDSVMHDPDVNPLARRLVDRVDSELSEARTRFFAPSDEPATCLDQNPAWQSVEIDLDDEPLEVGHVFNATADGQAVLVVVTRVNLDYEATRLNLSTSLEATGVFINAAQRSTFIEIEPPATMARRLRDPGGRGIERISICYVGTGDVEASPSPLAQPTETPEPIETHSPTSTATERPTQTPTTEPTETLVPTVAPTRTTEPTSTETPAPTATETSSPTPTHTAEPTATEPPSPTVTNTATAVPTATATGTPEPTATNTETPVPTATNTETPMPTATSTATATESATETSEPTATSTATPSPIATGTDTPMPTATPSETPTPTATASDTPVPSATATPSDTPQPTATHTETPRPTATSTETLAPTSTETLVPTATSTPQPTDTATTSPRDTATASPTETATASPTSTATMALTETKTAVPTRTAATLPTATATTEPSATSTLLPMATATIQATATETPEPTPTPEPTEKATIPSTLTTTEVPTATATPADSPTPAPTMTAMATLTVVAPPVASETISVATPSPAGGTPGPSVIYSTGETGDFSAWTVSEGWSAELGLHATGDGDGGWAIPPVTVTETQDYAVEIDFVLLESHECPRNFGVAIRGSEAGYYAAGIDWDCDQMAVLWAGQNRLESHSLSLDQSLHVLRIEAIGDRITYSIDGRVLIEATDATYPTGGEIGIWANGVAISITAFRIYDLTASTNGG